MSKPYIRICKNYNEGIIVSTGDIGVTCQHCGAEHQVEWAPQIHLGKRGW